METIVLDPTVDEPTLLRRYHTHGDLEARRQLIERMMALVRRIARRYANRGEALEDLVQVGSIGLVKAVDRFDPARGVKLSTFAEPNISGEIKRHFRDRGWAIHVQRDLQELGAKVNRVTEQLSARLGRAPTVGELAEALDLPRERVLDAVLSNQGYAAASLNERLEDGGEGIDRLGGDDDGFDRAETLSLLRDGLETLPEREKRIVFLRFHGGLTQREIADRVGMSQMHVSRLLRRSLDRMRRRLEGNLPEHAMAS